MRRLHLVELGDLPFLPGTLRQYATDLLRDVFTRLAPRTQAVLMVERLLDRADEDTILDLCSGSAGPMPWIRDDLEARRGQRVRLVLTDYYPHLEAYEAQRLGSGGRVDYVRDSVDARDVPPDLRGVRTLCSAFHHFRPADALGILRDAAQKRRAIGVFEPTERSLRAMLTFCVSAPLAVLLSTPFIKPFRWSRLFWTYVVPVVPLIVIWDGIVSCLRTYSPQELRDLTALIDAPGYAWEIGKMPVTGIPVEVTYLLGYPTPTS